MGYNIISSINSIFNKIEYFTAKNKTKYNNRIGIIVLIVLLIVFQLGSIYYISKIYPPQSDDYARVWKFIKSLVVMFILFIITISLLINDYNSKNSKITGATTFFMIINGIILLLTATMYSFPKMDGENLVKEQDNQLRGGNTIINVQEIKTIRNLLIRIFERYKCDKVELAKDVSRPERLVPDGIFNFV